MRLQLEAAALQESLRAHDLMRRHVIPDYGFRESHGDPVPLSDYPEFDHPHFGYRATARRRGTPWSNIDDRQDGKWRPSYETEADLARMRGEARGLAAFTAVAIGAVESLNNYTLGEGFTFKAQPADKEKSEQADAVAMIAQRVIDDFLDYNDFQGDLDRELHSRSREDGESLLKLDEDGRHIAATIIEPDQLVQPADPRPLEDWLDQTGMVNIGGVPSWSFGVLTRHRSPQRPLGYHVVYDGKGTDWDFIPAERMEHFKRNVGRNAKRGVSDFLPIGEKIESEAKLQRNTAKGAAVLAAIALIRKHPAGTLKTDIESMRSANALFSYTKHGTESRTKKVYQADFGPGTIIDGSSDYMTGPMGSLNQPVYIDVAKYILRSIAQRWNMPEYMISSDASNANYSSTLVAESPFVKSREADQAWLKRRFHSLIWKVLKLAWQRGWFDRYVAAWSQVEALIDVKIDPPEVATRNRQEQVSVDKELKAMGVKSPRTIATEHGLDFDEEVEAGAKADQPMGAPAGPPAAAATGIPESLRENCGTGAGGFASGNECGGESATLGEMEFPRFSEPSEAEFRKIDAITSDATARAWGPKRDEVMGAWKEKAKVIAERHGLKNFNADFLDDSMADVADDMRHRIAWDLQDHIGDDGTVNKERAIQSLTAATDRLAERAKKSPQIERVIEREVRQWAKEDGQRIARESVELPTKQELIDAAVKQIWEAYP